MNSVFVGVTWVSYILFNVLAAHAPVIAMELSVAAMATCATYPFYEGCCTSKWREVECPVVTSLNVYPPLHRIFTIRQHSSQARFCVASTAETVETIRRGTHRAAVCATFRCTIHLLLWDVGYFVRVVVTNCLCVCIVIQGGKAVSRVLLDMAFPR